MENMDRVLANLEKSLSEHIINGPRKGPLGGVGVFQCHTPQALRQMPILQPILMLVVRGQKRVFAGSQRLDAHRGELILLPADRVVEVSNTPAGHPPQYLSLALGFLPEVLAQFRREYGPELGCWDDVPRWQAPAPTELVLAMCQWVEWCRHYPTDLAVVRHRQVEFLLLLARAGLAGNLILPAKENVKQRLVALISLDPGREWLIGDVCRQLGMSESSLRRRLREMGTGFRETLESVRLVAGLGLLQETFWPVSQVAAAVGYQSQSRFSDRFKARFGITPSELRQTRMTVSSENLDVQGETAG